jgi:hypothetical protein
MIISSGLLYGYYHLFLRNKKFHQYNRYYLLSAMLISVMVPFLDIPVYFAQQDNPASWMQTLSGISGEPNIVVTGGSNHTPVPVFKWAYLLIGVYAVIATLILTQFIAALIRIRRLLRKYEVQKLEDVYFINTEEKGTPFSFFSWMFWNQKINVQSEDGQQVFRHELYHIRQKHSWDTMFTEIITIVFWINPFFHLIKKELKTIHEFLADQFGVRESDQWKYAELLLMHLMNTPNLRLTNPFFHNQIKRRIAMITSSKQPRYRYFRKILVLPLLALIAMLFAFTYKQRHSDAPAIIEQATVDSVPRKLNGVVEEPVKIILTDKASYKIVEDKQSDASEKGKAIKVVGSPIKIVTTYAEVTEVPAIRGIGSGDPLIVVDGVVRHNQSHITLQTIDPQTIVSITVLKDENAIKKYGAEGAAGVIEITTKKREEKEKADLQLEEKAIEVRGYKLEKVQLDNVVVVEGTSLPKFPGGQVEWRKYLERNLNAGVAAANGAAPGQYTVKVQFLVDKEGNISDISPITKIGHGMEEEVIRVIKLGPKWIPAMKDGNPIERYKQQPITFVVADSKETPELKEVTVADLNYSRPLTATELQKLSSIYPNPASQSITIPYSSQMTGKGEIKIYDLASNLRMTVPVSFLKGSNTLSANVGSLSKGMYVVMINDGDKKPVGSYKFLKE